VGWYKPTTKRCHPVGKLPVVRIKTLRLSKKSLGKNKRTKDMSHSRGEAIKKTKDQHLGRDEGGGVEGKGEEGGEGGAQIPKRTQANLASGEKKRKRTGSGQLRK